jgi:hypothetical protein
MWPTPPSSPRSAVAPSDENHAAEPDPRRLFDSPLTIVMADGVKAKARAIAQASPHPSTSAAVSVPIDASRCVDVTDSDDELVPSREQEAREPRMAHKPTVAIVNDRAAHESNVVLDTVDAPNTPQAHRGLESGGARYDFCKYMRAGRPRRAMTWRGLRSQHAGGVARLDLSRTVKYLSTVLTKGSQYSLMTIPMPCLQGRKSSCQWIGVRNSTLRLHKEEV